MKTKVLLSLLFLASILSLMVISGCNPGASSANMSSQSENSNISSSMSSTDETVSTDPNSSNLNSSNAVESDASSDEEEVTAKMFVGMTWKDITAKFGTNYKSLNNDYERQFTNPPYTLIPDDCDWNSTITNASTSVKGAKLTKDIVIGMTVDELNKAVGQKVKIDEDEEAGDKEAVLTDGDEEHLIYLYFDDAKKVLTGGRYQYKTLADQNETSPSSVAPVSSAAPVTFTIVDHTDLYTQMHYQYDNDVDINKSKSTRIHLSQLRGRYDAMNENYLLGYSLASGLYIRTKKEFQKVSPNKADGYYEALLKYYGKKPGEVDLLGPSAKVLYVKNEYK